MLGARKRGACGRRLTTRLPYRGEFEAAVLSTAIGWGAFGLAFFLLALAGLFTTPWVLALMATSQIACYRSWTEVPAHLSRWWAGCDARWRALIATGLGLALLPLLVLPQPGPTKWMAPRRSRRKRPCSRSFPSKRRAKRIEST